MRGKPLDLELLAEPAATEEWVGIEVMHNVPETPGSETKDFITHGTATSADISIFTPVPPVLKSCRGRVAQFRE